MTESERQSEIKKEISRLDKIFKVLPEDKKKLVDGLIQNAAFMSVTLRELQTDVVAHGAMIKAVSGNGFETIKDNPAQKAYTTMIARYSNVINQLASYLPQDFSKQAANENLLDWVNNH